MRSRRAPPRRAPDRRRPRRARPARASVPATTRPASRCCTRPPAASPRRRRGRGRWRWGGCSFLCWRAWLLLELPAQAEAGEDRKTLHRLAARVVVAVLQPFLAAMVVEVLDVEVRREAPGLELPALLDADARLVEQRIAGAVHAAVDRAVGVAV